MRALFGIYVTKAAYLSSWIELFLMTAFGSYETLGQYGSVAACTRARIVDVGATAFHVWIRFHLNHSITACLPVRIVFNSTTVHVLA